jgi:hypothetical protein
MKEIRIIGKIIPDNKLGNKVVYFGSRKHGANNEHRHSLVHL